MTNVTLVFDRLPNTVAKSYEILRHPIGDVSWQIIKTVDNTDEVSLHERLFTNLKHDDTHVYTPKHIYNDAYKKPIIIINDMILGDALYQYSDTLNVVKLNLSVVVDEEDQVDAVCLVDCLSIEVDEPNDKQYEYFVRPILIDSPQTGLHQT